MNASKSKYSKIVVDFVKCVMIGLFIHSLIFKMDILGDLVDRKQTNC